MLEIWNHYISEEGFIHKLRYRNFDIAAAENYLDLLRKIVDGETGDDSDLFICIFYIEFLVARFCYDVKESEEDIFEEIDRIYYNRVSLIIDSKFHNIIHN